jgi:hypothetical protein
LKKCTEELEFLLLGFASHLPQRLRPHLGLHSNHIRHEWPQIMERILSARSVITACSSAGAPDSRMAAANPTAALTAGHAVSSGAFAFSCISVSLGTPGKCWYPCFAAINVMAVIFALFWFRVEVLTP